jgi:tryptophanyl-tRNA synthetase
MLIILAPAKRIMSLTKPEKKMSKSDTNPKSRISIVDSKEEIERKIKAAVTDSEEGVSYDPTKRPELANLINMMHFLQEDTSVSPKDMISDLASKKALKDRLAGCVENHIAPIRERYHQLISRENRQYLDDIAHVGGQKANQNAAKTMKKVREVLGIGYPSPKPN